MDYLVDFLLNFYGPSSYFIILAILLACGFGVPIPEDITLFCAGLLSYYGICNVWVMIAVSMLGVLVGDGTVFWLGKTYGTKLTHKRFFKRYLPQRKLDQVSTSFNQRGNKLLFAARFMPGLRTPIFFSAGLLHIPFRIFLFYDGMAALISVPAIVYSVYAFGDELEKVIDTIKQIEHGIIFVIFAAIAFFVLKWYLKKKRKTA